MASSTGFRLLQVSMLIILVILSSFNFLPTLIHSAVRDPAYFVRFKACFTGNYFVFLDENMLLMMGIKII
jgi:hypothetical protein